MGELEKYGVLSLVCVTFLFLVLTFAGRDSSGQKLKHDVTPPSVVMLESIQSVASELTGRSGEAAAEPTLLEPEGILWESPTSVEENDHGSDPGTSLLTHVVRNGDTLGAIALQYLGSYRRWPELVAANHHLDPNRLKIGQELLIPDPTRSVGLERTYDRKSVALMGQSPVFDSKAGELEGRRQVYQVKEGDTLSGIATEFYGDAMHWRQIYDSNIDVIPDVQHLKVGSSLVLP